MSNLVLRARLALLRDNLDRVAQAKTTIDKAQARYLEFLELPDRVETVVREMLDHRDRAEAMLRDSDLDGLDTELEALRTQLKEVRAELSKLKERAAERLASAGAIASITVRSDVKDFLVRHAVETRNAMTDTWEGYLLAAPTCESLFSEYVDVLRGIAVRDAGFESGLFAIADHLPLLWGKRPVYWQSLAIPSRAERQMPTAGQVLRIGFPEWTVWALPVLQHEYGHLFVHKSPALRARIFGAGHQGDPDFYERTQKAIRAADAAATLIAGPAYAFAALLLRLDPRRVREGDDERFRSAVILAALERAAAPTGGPLLTTVRRLRNEWREAVVALDGSGEQFDGALGSAEVEEVLDVVTEELQRGLGVGPPPWLAEWEQVTAWAEELREDAPFDVETAVDVGGGDAEQPVVLTLLLNAAWVARVGVVPDADAPDDLVPLLGERTEQRCTQSLAVLKERAEPAVRRSSDRRQVRI